MAILLSWRIEHVFYFVKTRKRLFELGDAIIIFHRERRAAPLRSALIRVMRAEHGQLGLH